MCMKCLKSIFVKEALHLLCVLCFLPSSDTICQNNLFIYICSLLNIWLLARYWKCEIASWCKYSSVNSSLFRYTLHWKYVRIQLIYLLIRIAVMTWKHIAKQCNFCLSTLPLPSKHACLLRFDCVSSTTRETTDGLCCTYTERTLAIVQLYCSPDENEALNSEFLL